MSDPLDFTFTQDELYAAFRLALPDDEARTRAAEAARAVESGATDWAASEHLLLLLAIGSEGANTQVERIRHAMQQVRFLSWRQGNAAPGVTAEDLWRRWEEIVMAENREWAARRLEIERSLHKQGRLPPPT